MCNLYHHFEINESLFMIICVKLRVEKTQVTYLKITKIVSFFSFFTNIFGK